MPDEGQRLVQLQLKIALSSTVCTPPKKIFDMLAANLKAHLFTPRIQSCLSYV